MNISDVLKPEIIFVGRRRYRKPPMKTQAYIEDEDHYDAYYEEDLYCDDGPESCDTETCNIEKLDGRSGYKECLKDIPSFYCKYIVGEGNKNRKDIERQTNTSIQLPAVGCNGDIIITGPDKCSIIAARTKIKTIIEMHRGYQPAGHFLSIPLASRQLNENFEEFKKNVLAMKIRGMDASLFQHVEALHLTVCLLTFLNNEELESSLPDLSSITKDMFTRYFKSKGFLRIRVQGIEYMNDDPEEVDVLYAKIKLLGGGNGEGKGNPLQLFADDLVSTLTSEGYLKQEYDRVKLHATIINSIRRDDRNRDDQKRDSPSSKGGKKKNRVTFDARGILEEFSDFYFGEMEIRSLDVCIRKQFDADGRYKSAGVLLFS